MNIEIINMFKGHNNWVYDIEVSPDGSMMASGSADSTVRIWQIDKGVERHVLYHDAPVIDVAFSPDGKMIASASSDKTVRLWNVYDGTCLFVFGDHHSPVTNVTFLPNGKILASVDESGTIRFFRMPDGEVLCQFLGYASHDTIHTVDNLTFSPNGKVFATTIVDKIRIWRTADQSPIFTFDGHTDTIDSIAFSSNNRSLVSASHDKTIRLWDVVKGKCNSVLSGHNDWVFAAHYIYGNKVIVSSSYDKTIRLWNAQSGKLLHTYDTYDTMYDTMIPMSNSSLIIAASYYNSTICLWKMVIGSEEITSYQKAVKSTTTSQQAMTPEAYLRDAQRTLQVKKRINSDDISFLHMAIGLSGEVGEIVEIIKKAVFHNKPLSKEYLADEIGDALYYLTILADLIGYDLTEIMSRNNQKLRQRYPEQFDV